MGIFTHCQLRNTHRNKIFTVSPTDQTFNQDKYRDNGENIFKIYFQFGYYLGIIPFKIGENKLDRTIFLGSNKLQKVFKPITSNNI